MASIRIAKYGVKPVIGDLCLFAKEIVQEKKQENNEIKEMIEKEGEEKKLDEKDEEGDIEELEENQCEIEDVKIIL